MKPDERAREVALVTLAGVVDALPKWAYKPPFSVPARGSVSFAANGGCFVEVSLYIPPEALK